MIDYSKNLVTNLPEANHKMLSARHLPQLNCPQNNPLPVKTHLFQSQAQFVTTRRLTESWSLNHHLHLLF